ncbi:MAG: amylo-alpha-1,6-glucosidase [Thermobacillus sp.]|uniref:amylo-alpha-1,6-glucosidase n=1 Tax=Thermobacillus sp. TaxID=2108467 RepID=UPI000E365A18|nr:amylo-alpha-1,6-glucosidase [Thermobacillus sp.]REK58432.1 MAG: amylo-alpha-1,6-glucosidase [Thermobacillus sp.]
MKHRVIKENDLFFLTDESGDIPPGSTDGCGLYTQDTRFLSRLELSINGVKPILLESSAETNCQAVFRLTNPHMEEEGQVKLWRETVEIMRHRFIQDGVLYESIAYTNYGPKTVGFETSITVDADFADMFTVRGIKAGMIGSVTGKSVDADRIAIRYAGADGIARETRIAWNIPADRVSPDGTVTFAVELKPREVRTIELTVTPVIADKAPQAKPREEALRLLDASYRRWEQGSTSVDSDLEIFNKLYHRGMRDLRMLLTDLGHGPFPVAGLPWYAVPFGRDSLIAALQMLPANPEVALGTLRTMAVYQGSKVDPWRDETPGKIMHEIRYGELANTNQIPFTPYYGSVDSTPLFVVLAIEYYRWTGDLGAIRELMPALERALEWIDQSGDLDGDGFVEYHSVSSGGIANQGWKDSGDSIVHASGDFAETPIALAEVQGYVYLAKTGMAEIFRKLGRNAEAEALERAAADMKRRFEQSFWMADESFYAIALDREKRQVQSVTSNPGHLLMTGLPDENRAELVARRLTAEDMFSGYGIRTMSEKSTGYNPMSYHNGSVWPHDNSLCLIGMSRMGFIEQALKVTRGLMRAAEHFEYARLPELFCGYEDTLGRPVPYPVACSPQAWAAGTPLIFLQVFLGLDPDVPDGIIRLRPALPEGMNRLSVRQLRVGSGTLSLTVTRREGNAVPEVEVEHNSTGCELRVLHAIHQDVQN